MGVYASRQQGEERLGDDRGSDGDEDGQEEEQDPPPSLQVGWKRSKDGGKRTADNEVNRKRTAKGNTENSTTAAKDLSESNEKHRIVVISILKRTVPSTEEE